MAPPEKYLTVEELAELLHCKPITVHRRISDGSWPSSKPGRRRLFSPEHVAEIMKLTEQPAKPTRNRRRAS